MLLQSIQHVENTSKMSGKKFSRGTNKKQNFMTISNPSGKLAKKFIQRSDKH
jgi:hypothetical protein